MDKRYQVFVSSTYDDLGDERREVMQALLELDCIPAGMELFPAADDDTWTLIKNVIEDCDYYVVIIAGRYGSIGPDGLSYTEMEYRYAVDHGKPVMAFLHKDPAAIALGKSESSPTGKEKLAAFRRLAEKKPCRYWVSPSDLGGQVSRSLATMIKTRPAIGWVRANLVPTQDAASEILRLRVRNDELQKKLGAVRTRAPAGSEQFAQGDDKFTVRFDCLIHAGDEGNYGMTGSASLSWNTIFSTIAPLMIHEATDFELKVALNSHLADWTGSDFTESGYADEFEIEPDDFQTIKIQLRALGLIAKSERHRGMARSRSTTRTVAFWTLTPLGDAVMTALRAIKRPETQSSST